jgi:tRNA(fMet)-specific endonuclease VapC
VTIWVLDTDSVSLFQREYPPVLQQVQLKNADEIAVTVVTLEEQLRGWLNFLRRASSEERLIAGYRRLQDSLSYFCNTQLLTFTPAAADCYHTLIQQRIRIGTQDLRIGAIALSINATVVTRNQRDFSQIPGLRLEDWTIL